MTPTMPVTCGDDLERRWQAIRERFLAHADWLVRRGTLVAKHVRGRRVWVVRFATPREQGFVHRSIYIGAEPDLVRRDRACSAQPLAARTCYGSTGRVPAAPRSVAGRVDQGRGLPTHR
jgi:hypothetical protein